MKVAITEISSGPDKPQGFLEVVIKGRIDRALQYSSVEVQVEVRVHLKQWQQKVTEIRGRNPDMDGEDAWLKSAEILMADMMEAIQ